MTYQLPLKISKGEGAPIVLLHGLGNNHKSWTHVLKAMDFKKNKVYVYDLLGFGDAPKPTTIDYSLDDHADAVIAAMDKANITQALVAGHSMGCLVAAAVATKRPDLVANLVLLGAPTFRHMPRNIDRLKFWKKEDIYSKVFRFIRNNPDLTVAAATGVDTFLPMIKGMEVTEDTWPAFQKSLKNTIMTKRSFKELSVITVPTLIVYGYLDLFVIKSNLKSLARRNKKFVTYRAMLGPHEITPIHGKQAAELLQTLH